MRKHNRGRVSSVVDADFAEALEGDAHKRDSAGKRAEHKTRQLCRQAQKALNLALAERGSGLGLELLYVDEVTPVGGSGCLLVHFVAPAGQALPHILTSLRRMGPQLRALVAVSINRKRAPELSFVPSMREGGSDG